VRKITSGVRNCIKIGYTTQKSGADIVDIGIIAGKNSPNYIMEILKIGRYLL
jgi:hypothetical protein